MSTEDEMIEKIRTLDALTDLMWAHQENLIERMHEAEKQIEALQARVHIMTPKD